MTQAFPDKALLRHRRHLRLLARAQLLPARLRHGAGLHRRDAGSRDRPERDQEAEATAWPSSSRRTPTSGWTALEDFRGLRRDRVVPQSQIRRPNARRVPRRARGRGLRGAGAGALEEGVNASGLKAFIPSSGEPSRRPRAPADPGSARWLLPETLAPFRRTLRSRGPNPEHVGTRCAGLQGDGELEARLADVSDPDERVRNDLEEFRLVRIGGPIRAVHRERPLAARPELERVERVRESVRAPPASQARGFTEGPENGPGAAGSFREWRKRDILLPADRSRFSYATTGWLNPTVRPSTSGRANR